MMNEDELAEETRLEQEREMERIRWLRELHEKSLAEEREKKKFLQEERKKQKSEESTSNQVILLDDDSDHGLGEALKERFVSCLLNCSFWNLHVYPFLVTRNE